MIFKLIRSHWFRSLGFGVNSTVIHWFYFAGEWNDRISAHCVWARPRCLQTAQWLYQYSAAVWPHNTFLSGYLMDREDRATRQNVRKSEHSCKFLLVAVLLITTPQIFFFFVNICLHLQHAWFLSCRYIITIITLVYTLKPRSGTFRKTWNGFCLLGNIILCRIEVFLKFKSKLNCGPHTH